MIPVKDISLVDELISTHSSKSTLTNNYLLKEEYITLIQQNRLWYLKEQNNIYFLVQKKGFFRVYYFINDIANQFTNTVIKEPLVLEILYRGNASYPETHVEFWKKSQFSLHIERDCYFLKNTSSEADSYELPDSSLINVRVASTKSEFELVKYLIDTCLDPYTGNPLSIEEIQMFAQKGLILIASIDGSLVGFLQAEMRNNIFWLGNIVIARQYRGRGISNVLLDTYLQAGKENNCLQFQLWVDKQNVAAVSLYKKYRFNYLNKSTVSMIHHKN